VIDGDICVTVLAIKGQKVRIGVSAPARVLVDRQEVYKRRPQFVDASDQLTLGSI
jgi:carbon storage regulator CsrA